jgi:hypothetical protein
MRLVPGTDSMSHAANFLRWLVCGLLVALFTWVVTLYYIPGKGFTYLIGFGGLYHSKFLPEVRAANHYEEPQSYGYDAQWYAQIAMHPDLADPALDRAVDSLPYRARRILFEWTAWILGGGNPRRVMNVFAVQNVVCWYILAALLLRWFPPVSWGNCFRWAAVLFSFGLVFSVRGALLDGPSLLLVAIAMALIELKRPWCGALVLGISGLSKDTSVLSGSALSFPDFRQPRTWVLWLGRIALVLFPLVAWTIYLRFWLGRADDIGLHNFTGTFSGISNKILNTVSSLVTKGDPDPWVARFDFLVLVGLLAQVFFFAFRIRAKDPWWRVGASYAALSLFLVDGVWEAYPSAATRVLLPMTLAFNVLVPRGGFRPVLLVLGNLGVFGSAHLVSITLPERLVQAFAVEGPDELRFNPTDGFEVEAIYGPRNWWSPEKELMPGSKVWDSWRWTRGDSSVVIHNPQAFGMLADVRFGLATVDERFATATIDGKVVWHAPLKPAHDNEAEIVGIRLPPGDTTVLFESDRPPVRAGGTDQRLFSFSVRNLRIILRSRL